MNFKNIIFSTFLVMNCQLCLSSEKNKEIIKEENTNNEQILTDDNLNQIKIHIVQKGDTVSSIAKKYSIDQKLLIKMNYIKDENYIFIGQNLKIPKNNFQQINKDKINKNQYHKVKEGENLTEISNLYGLSTYSIIKLNQIDNPNSIKVGSNLLIRLIEKNENTELNNSNINKENLKKNLKDNRYGPLTIKSEKLKLKYGRQILDVVHSNGRNLILSVKCKEKELDVRMQGRKWKGWMPVKNKFEIKLVNDACLNI